jgi:hypothetical protein
MVSQSPLGRLRPGGSPDYPSPTEKQMGSARKRILTSKSSKVYFAHTIVNYSETALFFHSV